MLKYSGAGSRQWARLIGPSHARVALGVAIDPSGTVYVAGGADQSLRNLNFAGRGEGFVAAYDASGSRRWGRLLGASNAGELEDVAAGSGSVYVTGVTDGSLRGRSYNGGRWDVYVAALK